MNRLLLILPGFALLTTVFSTAAAQKPKRDRYVITAEEIRQSGVRSTYEAIEQLRPQFLRPPRSARLSRYDSDRATPGIRIFLGDAPQDDIEVLKHIAAEQIQEIRYYRETEASGRLGVMDGSAAIVVTLKARPN